MEVELVDRMEVDDNTPDSYSVDDALENIGFGRFQLQLLHVRYIPLLEVAINSKNNTNSTDRFPPNANPTLVPKC